MRKLAAVFAILWTTVIFSTGYGAEGKLSLKAQELEKSLAVLKVNPHDKSAQMQYLQKFPRNIEAFQQLFNTLDFSELYDGADYIFVLSEIAQEYPLAVGELLVGLAKDAPQGADALSYLRQVTAGFAVNKTAVFAKILRSRSETKAYRVVKYLANVENHNAYKEYPLIIDNMRKVGEPRLAKWFEKARKERMEKPTHEQ